MTRKERRELREIAKQLLTLGEVRLTVDQTFILNNTYSRLIRLTNTKV